MVGYFEPQPTEGIRIVCHNLAEAISCRGWDVKRIDARRVITDPRAVRSLVRGVQIVHYVGGPNSSLILPMLRILGSLSRSQGVLLSALQLTMAEIPSWCRHALPDIVLVQSQTTENAFKSLGATTHFLPNGVDIRRFRPPRDGEKVRLKHDFGLDPKKPTLLFVGAIEERRGIDQLLELPLPGWNALVVGRPSTPSDSSLLRELRRRNCVVIDSRMDDIENVYRASDVFVFPVRCPRASMEMPLSVLEAMASELFVITTPFGALPRLFPPDDSFRYWTDRFSLSEVLPDASDLAQRARNRRKVTGLTWELLSEKVTGLYETFGQ